MNILIVKTSAIGDVTHTLPALHALHKHYPTAKIDWLVEESAADLVIGHPHLNRVLVSKRKKWLADFKKGLWRQSITESISFIKEIRKVKYDLLIDFQGLLKSSIFIALSRAVRKVGFAKGMEHAECSHLFLNEKIPPVDMNIHAVERETVLLQAIGIDEVGEYHLFVDDYQNKQIEALLKENGIESATPFIAINPLTTWPTKHWQKKKFAELADKILKKGIVPIFTGGKDDIVGVAKIISQMEEGGAINMAGKTSLKTLAALDEKALLVVCTDTGPMHIAAAKNRPVVAIFGPTAPWRTGPYGKKHKVVRLDLPCSPCLKKQCKLGTNACMSGITADSVMEYILPFIEKS